MRLLVVGAGSTGGYLGARLAAIGRELQFLVRPRRAGQLQQRGLRVISPHGDSVIEPTLARADALAGDFDAILLAVKGYQLDSALDDMAPAVRPGTMILPVLNGMRHLELIGARFGMDKVVGCTLKVATTLSEDGDIVQLTPLQEMAYGELDGSESPRILEFHAFMQGTGIDSRVTTSIRREMWEKWILLASLGGVTCLMRGPVGEIVTCPGGEDFIAGLLDEAVAVASAVGEAPLPAFVRGARELLSAKGSALASSMFRDLQHGRPVEVETVLGDLHRHAMRAGVPAPLLRACYVHLRRYQNSLDAGASAQAQIAS